MFPVSVERHRLAIILKTKCRRAEYEVLRQTLTLFLLPTSLVKAVFVMSACIPTTYIALRTTHLAQLRLRLVNVTHIC
jgi:hypothetical protein